MNYDNSYFCFLYPSYSPSDSVPKSISQNGGEGTCRRCEGETGGRGEAGLHTKHHLLALQQLLHTVNAVHQHPESKIKKKYQSTD